MSFWVRNCWVPFFIMGLKTPLRARSLGTELLGHYVKRDNYGKGVLCCQALAQGYPWQVVDWLVGWLAGWLAGWLVGWLDGWSEARWDFRVGLG